MPRFYLPTQVVSGRGCLATLGETVAGHGQHAMVVCGRSFARRTNLLDRVVGLLRQSEVSVVVYDRVTGEAELPVVRAGIELAREEGADVFVGLGGGSAIDTAKAIAGLARLPGDVSEYHGGRALEGPGLPFISVPTTAGTGAEVTKNAVLIDPRQGVKKSIRDDAWFARVALVDPELSLSMSPEVTASTGSDALCQAIESFTSIAAGPVTDALDLRAIELIGQGLPRAYARGDDIEAREMMSTGALMAGMAMASARLGGVHGMAHPLGSHFGIPHGVVCGLLLPHTMAYNVDHATAKYATIARLLGVDVDGPSQEVAAHRAVERVRGLLREVGIPERLSEFGVTRDQFDLVIAESLPSGSLQHNPRRLQAEDVGNILEAAL